MRFRHAPVLLLLVVALSAALMAPALAPAAPGPVSIPATDPASVLTSGAASASASGTAETSAGASVMFSKPHSAEASVAAAGGSIVAMTAAAERTGSGVMVSPGRILTSTRVLKQNDPTVSIMTVDGALHSFTVVARDENLGLVLLAADIPGVQPIAGWGEAGTLTAGDNVHMMGLQSGARQVLDLKGTISSPAAATGGDLILTDIKLDPLVEGGALITADGKLAGLVTAKSQSPELGELGWAVTSEAARKFIDSIAVKQKEAAAESAAVVIRRWIVRAVLAFILLLFTLFGWWFRRWYKRMEARERAAGEDADDLDGDGVPGFDGDRTPDPTGEGAGV
jgi:S1-C subfamily serine protease